MLSITIIIAAFIGVTALVGGAAIMLRGDPNKKIENRLGTLTAAGGYGQKKDKKDDASVLTSPLEDRPDIFELLFAKFGNVKLFLEQADVSISPSKFISIMFGLAVLGAMVGVIAKLHPGVIALLALVPPVFPPLWLLYKRKKRLAMFGKLLPDALELVARALRAGHSLSAGFQLVGSEMQDPIAKEFLRVYEEQNFGIPLEEALDLMTERVPNIDLRFFATAVILQRQTGGDLAEILDKIGRLIRDRFRIYGQIQALTGEGRLSGIVLLALPPFLFLAMLKLNPGYVMILFEDPLGKQMLAGGLVLQFIGALVIRKIINIKV